MAKEYFYSGCAAAAYAAKMAKVEVITSYPIRPYTGIMMELSKLVANGELDAEFVHGEGEHAQVSVTYGASASGARAYTGSSGVGMTYAMECYSPTAGGRYPCQMAVADRALDPPGDFGSEHTDVMSARDQGWIMGWCDTPQEVFDNTIMYYRIGEDPDIMLPQFVCQDGYFVSHIPGKVVVPEQSQVDEFLPPYNHPHPLDPHRPTIHGPQIFPDQGAAIDIQRAQAHVTCPSVIEKVVKEYNEIMGRNYSPFLDEYMTDDAEFVFFLQGGHARTARFAINHMRKKGVKVGMVRNRFMRPWPVDQVAEVCSKFKAVGTIETSTSYGGACRGGNLIHEVRASLYDAKERPAVTSMMAGLGGEVVTLEMFYEYAEILAKAAKTGEVDQFVYWAGFDIAGWEGARRLQF
jgi:pyruvate ferredoxin oxidoreductase alpha subunit/oxalate oxidoreductase subunit alpha